MGNIVCLHLDIRRLTASIPLIGCGDNQIQVLVTRGPAGHPPYLVRLCDGDRWVTKAPVTSRRHERVPGDRLDNAEDLPDTEPLHLAAIHGRCGPRHGGITAKCPQRLLSKTVVINRLLSKHFGRDATDPAREFDQTHTVLIQQARKKIVVRLPPNESRLACSRRHDAVVP